MSDLAAWPLKIDEEHEGIVLHVHGSEHFLYYYEAQDICRMAYDAMNGHTTFGEDYKEMAEAIEAQKQNKGNLLSKLGLRQPAIPFKRRAV